MTEFYTVFNITSDDDEAGPSGSGGSGGSGGGVLSDLSPAFLKIKVAHCNKRSCEGMPVLTELDKAIACVLEIIEQAVISATVQAHTRVQQPMRPPSAVPPCLEAYDTKSLHNAALAMMEHVFSTLS
jgi:hypothetical protein